MNDKFRRLNEDEILHHLQYVEHTPIEKHILKKRLMGISRMKKERMLLNKLREQHMIIVKQQNEINYYRNNLMQQNVQNSLQDKLKRVAYLAKKKKLNNIMIT